MTVRQVLRRVMMIGIVIGWTSLSMASEAEQKGNIDLGRSVYKEICFSCHGM